MTDLTTRTIDSPLGCLTLVASPTGLVALTTRPPQAPVGTPRAHEILDAAAAQLAEYFAGQRRQFDLSLEPRGTEFQRRVWRALGDIPYGETTSYGALARAVGQPGAARAVGAANGRNPLWIVVPCHRVIGSGGTLTGFAGGLEMKRALLALERGAESFPIRDERSTSAV